MTIKSLYEFNNNLENWGSEKAKGKKISGLNNGPQRNSISLGSRVKQIAFEIEWLLNNRTNAGFHPSPSPPHTPPSCLPRFPFRFSDGLKWNVYKINGSGSCVTFDAFIFTSFILLNVRNFFFLSLFPLPSPRRPLTAIPLLFFSFLFPLGFNFIFWLFFFFLLPKIWQFLFIPIPLIEEKNRTGLEILQKPNYLSCLKHLRATGSNEKRRQRRRAVSKLSRVGKNRKNLQSETCRRQVEITVPPRPFKRHF